MICVVENLARECLDKEKQEGFSMDKHAAAPSPFICLDGLTNQMAE